MFSNFKWYDTYNLRQQSKRINSTRQRTWRIYSVLTNGVVSVSVGVTADGSGCNGGCAIHTIHPLVARDSVDHGPNVGWIHTTDLNGEEEHSQNGNRRWGDTV